MKADANVGQVDTTDSGVGQGRGRAALVLEDGTSFLGWACGAVGEAYGEICFNTSLVGYQEVISDPSYAGQIITMTYPQIGNYGTNRSDMQRDKLALRGLVVHDICYHPSNFRSEQTLPELLQEDGVVALAGIDTRMLVRHIRDNGAMRAVISTVDLDFDSLLAKVKASPSLLGINLASTVSVTEPFEFSYRSDDDRPQMVGSAARALAARELKETRYHVVAYDCGAKRSILRGLVDVGCDVEVVPWDTPASEVLERHPDGVFFSNGPGDPEPVHATQQAVRELLGKLPIFGICLGHQMIDIAVGGKCVKLKYGHRGGNHPVMNLLTGRVEITAQNHGFNIDPKALGPLLPEFSDIDTDDMREWVKAKVAPVRMTREHGRVQLTHVNLNDGTAEGLRYLDMPTFSVQYHPEASPGPQDSSYLFQAFARLMDGREDYLDIDDRVDRLHLGHLAVSAVSGAQACDADGAAVSSGAAASDGAAIDIMKEGE